MYAVAMCDVCDCYCLCSLVIGCIVLSVKLDENAFGYIEEGEFVESADQDQDYFAEQGKLLSELAPKYLCI